jgi:hypothetical protein
MSDGPFTRYAGEYTMRPIYRAGTQIDEELWMPAIPLPFYGLRKRCVCGHKFWTMEGYRAHYALAHILEDGPTGGQE